MKNSLCKDIVVRVRANKIILMLFASLFICFVNASAMESLKDIKHEDMGFEARVPTDWILKSSEKSVRYLMSVHGGKMDVKHWPSKSASQVVDKLKEKISSSDAEYIEESFVVGENRVVSFAYETEVKSITIKQHVNVIDTSLGLYVVQFAAKSDKFNELFIGHVLASFRVLSCKACPE